MPYLSGTADRSPIQFSTDVVRASDRIAKRNNAEVLCLSRMTEELFARRYCICVVINVRRNPGHPADNLRDGNVRPAQGNRVHASASLPIYKAGHRQTDPENLLHGNMLVEEYRRNPVLDDFRNHLRIV
jgi:hypothetical protein